MIVVEGSSDNPGTASDGDIEKSRQLSLDCRVASRFAGHPTHESAFLFGELLLLVVFDESELVKGRESLFGPFERPIESSRSYSTHLLISSAFFLQYSCSSWYMA